MTEAIDDKYSEFYYIACLSKTVTLQAMINIQRLISWFHRNSEELAGEPNIDHIDFETLKSLFNPPETDPLMYDPYNIDEEKSAKLAALTGLAFDHQRYSYQVDCFQI